jgi:NAD(P)-dependent dehydrogenase (short-subunit alcohol dehydrogenase family)
MRPTSVVITGSTRGIGYGLAEAFRARGCAVTVCGRGEEAVARAVARLSEGNGGASVAGHACDVSEARGLEALWDAAERAAGGVDVWINNAGTCNAVRAYVELPPEEIAQVVDVNLRGTMLGSRVAAARMIRQGRGKLFNMEGWGSRGEWKDGMTPYCTTKRALRYFTDALARETARASLSVGTLSPGMVITDLLVDSYKNGAPANWRSSRWLFNFVIDPPEKVCTWLAGKVLGNRRTGAHYTWMTPLRLLVRFFQPKYWTRNAFAGTALDAIGRDERRG